MKGKVPIEKLIAEAWTKVIDVGINNQVWKKGNDRILYDSHDQVIVRQYSMDLKRQNRQIQEQIKYEEEARGI